MHKSREKLSTDLKKRILTLELEPGSDLDETSLSNDYGLSRTPLREVFRELAGEGYIQISNNRGAIVAPMSHMNLRDFFLTAPMIYSSIARLAARNGVDDKLLELKTTQENFKKAVFDKNVNDSVFWNDRFHYVIGEMAKNHYLMPSLRRLLIDHARIGQTFWRADDNDKMQNIQTAMMHHDDIIKYIENRDEEAVVAVTRAHWDLSKDHIDMFIHPTPLEIEDL